ncbi:MAG: hypothetical protein Q8O10_09960 [candidate division Zixibacteria bacterium]|nr:hypothetical protein [candidate division Zixibacteria bacterium]
MRIAGPKRKNQAVLFRQTRMMENQPLNRPTFRCAMITRHFMWELPVWRMSRRRF